MMINRLLATLTIVLSVTALPASTVGDLVIYEIDGNARVTHSTLGVFANESFNIVFEIDDNQIDLLPGDLERGGFDMGIVRISVPTLGLNDEISPNVTGLVLVDTTTERFRLVDPTDFFGGAAIGLEWSTSGAIDDPNVIATLNPVPPPNVAWGGLDWQLGRGDTLTLSNISNVTIQSRSVVVPEGNSMLVLISLIVPTLFRKRSRKWLDSE